MNLFFIKKDAVDAATDVMAFFSRVCDKEDGSGVGGGVARGGVALALVGCEM